RPASGRLNLIARRKKKPRLRPGLSSITIRSPRRARPLRLARLATAGTAIPQLSLARGFACGLFLVVLGQLGFVVLRVDPATAFTRNADIPRDRACSLIGVLVRAIGVAVAGQGVANDHFIRAV